MQQYQPSPSSSVSRYRHQHASDYIAPSSSTPSAYSSTASDWHSASRASYNSSTVPSTTRDWRSVSSCSPSQPSYSSNSTVPRYRHNHASDQLPSSPVNSSTASDWRSVSSQPSSVTVFSSSRDGVCTRGDGGINVNVRVQFNFAFDASFTMPSNSSMAVCAGKAVVGKGIEALGNAPYVAGPALAAGIEFGHCGYDLYKLNQERMSGRITERKFRVSATERVSEATVGGSLALGGCILGGAIGSCVPGIGTAVGGFVGNVVGSAAGLIVGKVLGSSLGNWLGERMW